MVIIIINSFSINESFNSFIYHIFIDINALFGVYGALDGINSSNTGFA